MPRDWYNDHNLCQLEHILEECCMGVSRWKAIHHDDVCKNITDTIMSHVARERNHRGCI
jgi:hypothetical protein